MRMISVSGAILVLGLVALMGCSDDSTCPTCPTCYTHMEWVTYDSFDDDTLNAGLWSVSNAYGGQVLETSGQLQVWGHTGGWTGLGDVKATKPSQLAWKFDLNQTYVEFGPGCQGWHIRAYDPDSNLTVEVANMCTASCTSPPNWGDVAGTYEIWHESGYLSVYRDGSFLRRVSDQGIGSFVMEFAADNAYGSGHHCHIFVDNVKAMRLAP